MEDKLTIRDATTGDVSTLRSFLRKMMNEEMEASGGHPTSTDENAWNRLRETLCENLRDGEYKYVIAETSDDPPKQIGFAEARILHRTFVYEPARVLHIHSLFVEPSHRGRGLGGLLLEAVMEWGRTEKCAEAELDVLAGNPARFLYRRLGFRPFEFKMMRRLQP